MTFANNDHDGTTSFVENFWSLDENNEAGFQRVSQRMKRSIKSTTETVDFFHQRALIEGEYFKQLTKSCDSVSFRYDSNTVKTALEKLNLQSKSHAVAHQYMAEQMMLEVEAPLKALREELTQLRKKYVAMVDSCAKNLNRCTENVNKAKKSYFERCQRWVLSCEKARQAPYDPNNSSRDVEKMQAKANKLKAEAEDSQTHYRSALAKWTVSRQEWENRTAEACQIFQKCEEKRIDSLQVILQKLIDMETEKLRSHSQVLENMKHAVATMDTAADMTHFVEKFRTGHSKPPRPHFEPYPFDKNSSFQLDSTHAHTHMEGTISPSPTTDDPETDGSRSKDTASPDDNSHSHAHPTTTAVAHRKLLSMARFMRKGSNNGGHATAGNGGAHSQSASNVVSKAIPTIEDPWRTNSPDATTIASYAYNTNNNNNNNNTASANNNNNNNSSNNLQSNTSTSSSVSASTASLSRHSANNNNIPLSTIQTSGTGTDRKPNPNIRYATTQSKDHMNMSMPQDDVYAENEAAPSEKENEMAVMNVNDTESTPSGMTSPGFTSVWKSNNTTSRDQQQAPEVLTPSPAAHMASSTKTFSRRSIKMEGWMHIFVDDISSSQHEQWTTKWSTLEGGYIWFFDSPEDNNRPRGQAKPLFMIPLKDCDFLNGVPADFGIPQGPPQGYTEFFTLTNMASPQRKRFIMRVDNPEEKAFWVTEVSKIKPRS